jgi:heat shock protein HslJ
VPRSPGDLVDTHWVLVETGDADEVPRSSMITLDIADGSASGAGPCNRYRLAFTHDGEDVVTGPVTSTQIACAPRLAAGERRYFGQLERVDRARKEGTEDHLVLSGPDARLTYEDASAPASELTGTWEIVTYATTNAMQTPVARTEPTLHFGSDGTLTAETGCNTGHTTWKSTGRSVAIAPLRATHKACPTPPGVTEQEARIFDALTRTATADVARRDAVLLDRAGAMLFVLTERS